MLSLTPREGQVLQILIRTGASNKIIARELGCSESNIKAIITHLLRKHYLRHRSQLIIHYLHDKEKS